MSRRMVKLVHADGFFPNNDAENLRKLCQGLVFVEKDYGLEIPDFNLIFPDCESIFYKVLGERVTIDPKRSGVIRKPADNAIHFEQFDSTEEWCFAVALEPTTVNFWHHIDPNEGLGDFSKPNGYTALDCKSYDFKNFFEWKVHTNILLEQNQGLFFRPWVFHSLAATMGQEGLVQYYRVIADPKFRILVMGLPGSCRSAVAKKLAQRIGGDASYINSFEVRKNMKDIDFTEGGMIRHAYRVLNLARGVSTAVSVIDMASPIPKMREIVNADIVVWANDRAVCEYSEINDVYEPPFWYDIECTDDSDQTIDQIIKRIMTKKY